MKLLQEVLEEIKPSKEQEKEVKEVISSFISKLNKGLENGKAILGGSGAKETWLSGAHDADIFVQFNYNKFKDKSDKISDILEKHLKKNFKIKRLHGSRDYFHVKQGKYTFEIIPILKVSKAKKAVNITDVSPLHADWVKKHNKYADEIRLCKQFCKANEIYGAESYIMGLSGYICEILTIYYKGFLQLVRAAAKWQDKTVIDAAKYYKNRNDALFNLNKSKIVSPLVIIDPVQKDRNAAAAMSNEKYEQFIGACKEFIRKPSKEFFIEKEITIDDLKERTGKDELILVKVEALAGKHDVVGCKLLKAVDFINNKLKKNDFIIYEHGWEWDKGKNALVWFIVDSKKLSEYAERPGPPIKMKDAVKNFKKEHKKTFVKKGKIIAKDKRKFIDASKFIKFIIKDKYLEDKVKSIKV